MGRMAGAGEIAELLINSNDIIIATHTGPDGDAVGSAAALLLALLKAGKNARAVIEALPRKFAEIPGAELFEFKTDGGSPFKTFVAVDCADRARLGKFAKYIDAAEVSVNIDHHASNDFFCAYNYVEENASAASELVYKILDSGRGFEIDKSIASALYAGILYDTGGFRHASASAFTYTAAGVLIERGADFRSIYKRFFHSKRFEEIKILATAFSNMQRAFGGRLVWTCVSGAEMERAGAKSVDLDEVVDFCKSVEGGEIAAFIYERNENEFKLSLRSEPGYDVAAVAAEFGGGGHKNAAGAVLTGSLEQCVAAVFEIIGKVLSEEG